MVEISCRSSTDVSKDSIQIKNSLYCNVSPTKEAENCEKVNNEGKDSKGIVSSTCSMIERI